MNGTLKPERPGPRPAGLTLDELRRRAAERGRIRYLEKVIPLLIKRQRELKNGVYGGLRLTQSWAFLPGRPGPADPTAAAAARAAEIEQHVRLLTGAVWHTSAPSIRRRNRFLVNTSGRIAVDPDPKFYRQVHSNQQ